MRFIIFITALLGTATLILLSGFRLPTQFALMVLLLAVTSDFYTTWECLKMRGREGNPVVAFLFKRVGLRRTFGVMAIAWTCSITFRWLPSVEGIQTAVALAYWLVPVNNIIVLVRLSRKARRACEPTDLAHQCMVSWDEEISQKDNNGKEKKINHRQLAN